MEKYHVLQMIGQGCFGSSAVSALEMNAKKL